MNARSLIKYVRLVDLNENWAMVSNPYEDDLKDVAGLHLKIFPHSLIIFRLHTRNAVYVVAHCTRAHLDVIHFRVDNYKNRKKCCFPNLGIYTL